MPTVVKIDGYEISIYLHDHAPPHVHVYAGGSEVIINLNCLSSEPEIRESYRFKRRALRSILNIVIEHQQLLCNMWKEIHGYL